MRLVADVEFEVLAHPDALAELADAALHPLVEVGERQLGAGLVTGLRDRPGQAALIGDPTDKNSFSRQIHGFLPKSPSALRS